MCCGFLKEIHYPLYDSVAWREYYVPMGIMGSSHGYDEAFEYEATADSRMGCCFEATRRMFRMCLLDSKSYNIVMIHHWQDISEFRRL